MITKKYLINGPNNVVRLTNGKKIIYIFGDIHLDAREQNECPYNEKHESLDIDKFLLKFFNKETEKKFDVFVEVQQDDLLYYKNNPKYKDKYLFQMRKMLSQKINIQNNTTVISKKIPNVRFHYFDFRFYLLQEFTDLFSLPDISNMFNFPFNYEYMLTRIENMLKTIIEKLNNTLDFLLSNEPKYINKIKNVYSNDDIKKKINLIYDILVVDYIKYIINLSNEVIEYIVQNKTKITLKYLSFEQKIDIQKDFFIKLNLIDSHLIQPFSILTDLYLLRRILDKKYTNNNIIYTGSFHMIDIVVLLVKFFDFEITNIFYNGSENNDNSDNSDNSNIIELNKYIKNVDISNYKYFSKLYNIFYNEDNNIIEQCVNLFDFPPNFS
jgi:hypothetical protein